MLSLLRTSSNLKTVGYQFRHVTMDSSISQLKHLFAGAVDAVKPGAMFERYLGDESVLRQLQNADKNYHLVGFGKAVLGMAVQMERILGDRLTSGCISIPVGTLERFRGEQDFQLSRASKIQVLECAANNLPDEAAVQAARKIQSVTASMTARDVLCVLVSGGGSALLPLPKSPINLTEKLTIIKQLASAGASIDELNVVRIQLSDVKGGKLASSASKSNKVLSFIISDIIGDPLELIASGPTVQSDFSNEDALNILKKYNLALVKNPDRDILLVSGGEPTVIVKGTGLGGRNQELALRFSVQCFQQELLKGVLLLSAGTDGIDGPTDAAGAIGGTERPDELVVVEVIYSQNLSSDQYPNQLFKMKFVLILAALVAVAFAAPSESTGTLDAKKLQEALIIAGMNPEEAHGFMDFIRGAGRVIRDKVLPAATKILPIATQIAGAFGK
ncbi:glycerate kinase isoform X2 [Culex pipiens pallens]|uniref:glycerate kinase isoform X2 n=1 Tax=Culex pipiens pallens TaxID=42434 RepID=UPI001955003B|nr:glycerate kinase isoform X2 [Culex pipiens pallens]